MKTILQHATVEPAMFSYFLAIYLLYSVFQPTVFSRVCTTYLSSTNSSTLDSSMCSNIYSLNSSEAKEAIHFINKETNHWIKISSICSTLPSLVVDCLMGSWSDLFGRKMPMYLPSIGGLLATIVYVVFICFEEVGVEWLCLASLLSGAFGGFTSVIGNSFAYVASISEKESRTLRCSVVESMAHLAATVGPFLSKSLKLSLSPLAVFIASGFCHLVNIVYCLNLKEPTKIEQKKEINIKNLFSFSHFLESFKTVFLPREGSGRIVLISLLLGLFIVQNVLGGELDILYVFLANTGSAHVFDYFFGFKNFLGAVALLVVLPLAKWMLVSDYLLCLAGLISFMSSLVVLGLSQSTTMVFVSGLVGLGSKLVDSVLRALISQAVRSEEVGKVFGIVAVLGDLAIILGALLFNSLYTPLSYYMAGATYFVGSAMLIIPLAMVCLSWLLSHRNEKRATQLSEGKDKEDQVHFNKGYQNEEVLSYDENINK